MTIRLDDKVAIVTGSGGGLGRCHALALAARGARVVVNDLGEEPAEKVAEEIRAAGGEAIAHACSVADFAAVETMVRHVMDQWGRVDILVNNAGILRDKTFVKMNLEDFRTVLDVHLMGAVNCTKAVWEIMRDQQYGRIVMTTSSSGLFGNFGQSNYGAAKLAMVGLMQTLSLEGEKYNIRVNSLAPTAATQMTEGLMPPEVLEKLRPETVSPGVVFLCSEDAPNRAILAAGAGSFECAHITLTRGVYIGEGEDAADEIAARFSEIADRTDSQVPRMGSAQGQQEMTNLIASQKKS
ncbi:NAD(P)-dependent dehydrogenase, short-chain alcohol dehydrogenase family [Marinobacter daqiaonensis]|uniref:2,3-dihydroxy-2,3-dihydro-p-cumate dehydrogenase n=1 Tax=Marinobacter daqiaonensis TaxID=650891 RepID=A0A1I6I5U6_9GAMM|nr:SDR family NAD(P)-dependent oxidoreductase [Marinobacter daqiaonensis]SFR62049.1 NAD(P)-dependent dehydrogenase, short-chain alcohol dehydrogenase family [Marinobacter daqiaonensis]